MLSHTQPYIAAASFFSFLTVASLISPLLLLHLTEAEGTSQTTHVRTHLNNTRVPQHSSDGFLKCEAWIIHTLNLSMKNQLFFLTSSLQPHSLFQFSFYKTFFIYFKAGTTKVIVTWCHCAAIPTKTIHLFALFIICWRIIPLTTTILL